MVSLRLCVTRCEVDFTFYFCLSLTTMSPGTTQRVRKSKQLHEDISERTQLSQSTGWRSVTSTFIHDLPAAAAGHPVSRHQLALSSRRRERPTKPSAAAADKSHVAGRVNRDLLWVAATTVVVRPRNIPTYRSIRTGGGRFARRQMTADKRRRSLGSPYGVDIVKISTSVISSWPGTPAVDGVDAGPRRLLSTPERHLRNRRVTSIRHRSPRYDERLQYHCFRDMTVAVSHTRPLFFRRSS